MPKHAMLVGFPNGVSTEDQPVNVRTAAITVLVLASTACAATDSSATTRDVTDLTAVQIGQAKTSGLLSAHTTAAPSAPSNSTGPALSGLAVISDDFSEYASTADLMGRVSSLHGGTANWRTSAAFYSDGYGNNVSIDPTVQYNGHATMKYTQPGGTSGTPWLAVALPTPLTHIWYRVKVRFSPGFSTTGTLTNSANAYKMLSWGWGSGFDGSGRLEITNTTEYELYENVQQGPSLVGGGNYLNAGNISNEWTDGGWYDYIIEVDHTQPSGVIRLWRAKDGQTPVYSGQEAETMNNGSIMPPLTGITVGLNFNQVRAPGQNQAVWWGQWEVVDGTQHPNPFDLSH